jgi:hypothetical protein
MPNMSYCRFQNTSGDLEDCMEAMESREELSPEEREAQGYLVTLCERIVNHHRLYGLNPVESCDEDE